MTLSQPTYAADLAPPHPWQYLYFRMADRGGRKHESIILHLTNAELRWVGRVVAAEMRRRNGRKAERKA